MTRDVRDAVLGPGCGLTIREESPAKASGFKVGDRVICRGGTRYEQRGVVESADATMVTVRYDIAQGGCERGNFGAALWQFVAPALPINSRPIQPGDYIKDPGAPTPVDDPPLDAGELCYDHRHLTVMRVASGDEATVRYGDNSGGWDSRRSVRRLPPDAVLDEARSPRRDGVTSVVAGPVVVSGGHMPSIRYPRVAMMDLPPSAAEDRLSAQLKTANATIDDQAALLSRALILIGGWNTRYHGLNTAQIDEAKKLGADIIAVLRPVGEKKPGRG